MRRSESKDARVKLQPRVPSGREKDEAAVKLLAQLREKLHCNDISKARKAAYTLAWMQEDGLDILVEALFGNFPRTAKKAATYGLRRMNGRMKKPAEEALTKGLTHSNRTTKEACAKALLLMKEGPAKRPSGKFSRPRPGKRTIRDIAKRRGARGRSPRRDAPFNR
jgi:hypothetical protein